MKCMQPMFKIKMLCISQRLTENLDMKTLFRKASYLKDPEIRNMLESILYGNPVSIFCCVP